MAEGAAGMFALDGRVALVTGASQGIGLAIARALAGAGASIVMADLNPAVADRAAEITSARHVVCDVTSEADVARLFAEIEGGFGGLDILVNNAAILIAKPAAKLERAEWRRTIETNLTACFFVAQSAAKLMDGRGRGRIINMSSIVGRLARGKLAAYIAAKAGIDGMTRALACDFAGRGLTVNAIAPGFIVTEMSRTGNDRFERWVEETVPNRRWGTPEDIASVAVFLASDAAAYVNGQTIYVDGGFTAVSA